MLKILESTAGTCASCKEYYCAILHFKLNILYAFMIIYTKFKNPVFQNELKTLELFKQAQANHTYNFNKINNHDFRIFDEIIKTIE